ncbi:MAG: MarR family transcriptional regulator [Actinobacteria bacterium]|nr:MarR family transcriptional regulator [Actinomycetota bacterium]
MADERASEAKDGDERWYAELVLPVLLAEGRATYGRAIRKGYAEAGFDDIPSLGPRLLGGIRRFGGSVGSVGDVARDFGVSKQAASKLIDTLVVRGYVERGTDPEDRRRLTLELTERGREAADIGWEATERVDRALERAVGADAVTQMRETVGALVALESLSEE